MGFSKATKPRGFTSVTIRVERGLRLGYNKDADALHRQREPGLVALRGGQGRGRRRPQPRLRGGSGLPAAAQTVGAPDGQDVAAAQRAGAVAPVPGQLEAAQALPPQQAAAVEARRRQRRAARQAAAAGGAGHHELPEAAGPRALHAQGDREGPEEAAVPAAVALRGHGDPERRHAQQLPPGAALPHGDRAAADRGRGQAPRTGAQDLAQQGRRQLLPHPEARLHAAHAGGDAALPQKRRVPQDAHRHGGRHADHPHGQNTAAAPRGALLFALPDAEPPALRALLLAPRRVRAQACAGGGKLRAVLATGARAGGQGAERLAGHHPGDQKRPPVAKALFNKAQQEIFAMLRSSWFDRFTKSDLYKVALQDSMIHFDLVESKEDSPPKLLSRAFSSAEYSRVQAVDGDSASSGGEGEEDKDEERDEEERADSKGTTDNSDRMSANNSEQGSEIDSAEESEDREFAKVVLNLESIIRLTKLPEGLQVHYRPNYESPTANAPAPKDDDCGIDTILTFATFLEKQEDEDAAATLMLMPVPNPHKDKDSTDESFDDISRRIKTFLVPSGRILIKRSGGEKCPADMLFPFQQSGRNGFLFGSVYLTYEPVHVGTSNEEHYVAKGFCLLSHLPLVNSLRKLVEEHVQSSQEQSSIFAHDRLALLFQSSISWTRTTITSARTHTYVHPEMRRLAHRKHSSILSLPLSTLETQVDVPMTILFEQFGTAMVLQILASAVLECSIVVVASQYSLLTMCAEAIRNLLRPFSWCHVYAPVLPKPLLSYLQCPTPILVGVNSEFALRSDLPTRGFYLVADVDRKVVEYVGDQSVAWRGMGLRDDLGEDAIFLPRCFEAAKQELDRLLFPRALQYDSIGGCDTFPVDTGDTSLTYASPPETEAERDEQVRGICFDLFSELLSGHTNACLVVGDTKESVVIFDETEFLATRADEDSQFYQALLRTQCFSEIVSAHRINMSSKESDADAEALDADEDLQEGII
ncbi:hypothetical protein ON010_g12482 [Phytophthora cinnamomi]|nr:hypothetical protein ON010_g12482 [Phytophthora cinnamomi]